VSRSDATRGKAPSLTDTSSEELDKRYSAFSAQIKRPHLQHGVSLYIDTTGFGASNALILQTPPSGAPTTSSYDANGNLNLEDVGGGLTSYVWDSENRLLVAAYPTGQYQTMAYDAEGYRKQLINPTSSAVTSYVWDEGNVLYSVDEITYPTEYTQKPGDMAGTISQNVLSVPGYYGFDSSGNSRIVTSATGTIAGSYAYRAFGEPLVTAGI